MAVVLCARDEDFAAASTHCMERMESVTASVIALAAME